VIRASRTAAAAAVIGSIACGPKLVMPAPPAADTNAIRRDLAAEAASQTRAGIQRLLAVTTRLRVAGAPLCGSRLAWIVGAEYGRAAPGELDLAFHQALGLGDVLRVLVVLDGGPASRAGIEPGDVIVEGNGRAVDQSWELADELRRRTRPLELGILRGDMRRTVRLEPVAGCEADIEYAIGSGLRIDVGSRRAGGAVSSGFVDFARSDDELAVITSHALAHGILGHRSTRTELDHELEADRFGLFVAARAGYDVSVAPDLWERIAIEKPWLIAFDKGDGGQEAPHGRIGKRVPAMRAVVEAIRLARAQGLELRP